MWRHHFRSLSGPPWNSFVVYFSLCRLKFPNSIFEVTSRNAKVALQITKNVNRAEANHIRFTESWILPRSHMTATLTRINSCVNIVNKKPCDIVLILHVHNSCGKGRILSVSVSSYTRDNHAISFSMTRMCAIKPSHRNIVRMAADAHIKDTK